jgi:hypothetical protein
VNEDLFRRDRRERSRALPPVAAELGIHGLVLALGLCSAFHPTLFSGFARLQADPGDTLLNHYILEHSWRWLTHSDYIGTYWSPPFFHPQPLVLAYSENLLGTAPLYWLLRTACPQMSAYQLWMLLVTALTYVSFATVLRRLGVGHLPAALGGFVFAFGLPRVIQIGHQQLLPHLFAPWAELAAWRLLERPTLPALAGLLAAAYLQVLASIYLGWFLLAGLGLFVTAVLVLDGAARIRLTSFLRARWLAAAGLIVVWAALMAVLFAPYHEANRGFHRPYDEVLALTPRPTTWLASAPQGVWYRWLPKSAREAASELWIFPGAVPLAIAACGLAFAIVPHERRPLVAASLIAAVTLALIASRWGDWSPWRAVYKWAPGGGAIRAVGRVVFTVELFALVGGLVTLEALCHRARFGGAIAGLLLVAAIAEQLPNRPLPSFEVAAWQERVSALRDRLTLGTVAYIELAPDRPFWESQLTAMWAGLEANVPVVNGYSGRYPLGYPDWERSMTPAELTRWVGGGKVHVIRTNF